MRRSRFDGHVASIKAKFDELDSSKDGALEFEEVKQFLREKRPEAKVRDLKWWFQEYDKGKRGKMNFKDFSDFVRQEDFAAKIVEEREAQAAAKPATKLGMEEHAECRQASLDDIPQERESTAAEKEGLDWEVIKNVFNFYAGSDKVLQGNEFARLCRETELYDGEFFTPGHAEMVFGKFCEEKTKVMKKQGFRKALIAISTMKGVPITYFRTSLRQRAEQIQNNKLNEGMRRPSINFGSTPSLTSASTRHSINSTASPEDADTSPGSSACSACPGSSARSGCPGSSARSGSLGGSIAVALRPSGRKEGRPPLNRTFSTPALRHSTSLTRSKSSGKLEPSKSLKAAAGRMLTPVSKLNKSKGA